MRVSLLAALVATLATPALAGPFDAPPLEPTPGTDVRGRFAAPLQVSWTGGYVGGQIGFLTVESENDRANASTDADGAGVGVYAGYQHDLGFVIVGGELQYNVGDISVLNDAADVDYVARVLGRVGYDMGQSQIYATAGMVQMGISQNSGDFDDTGYSFGLGIDYRVGRRTDIGIAYTRDSIDDFNDSGIDITNGQIALRGTYRF